MPPDRPRLYAHPFSSYCQKVLVALYENHSAFDYRTLEDPRNQAELAALWPMKRFPVLVDGDRTRVVDEARPFRNCFPLGAPDRD